MDPSSESVDLIPPLVAAELTSSAQYTGKFLFYIDLADSWTDRPHDLSIAGNRQTDTVLLHRLRADAVFGCVFLQSQ